MKKWGQGKGTESMGEWRPGARLRACSLVRGVPGTAGFGRPEVVEILREYYAGLG